MLTGYHLIAFRHYRITLVVILTTSWYYLFAGTLPHGMVHLRQDVNELIYLNKYDSACALVLHFIDRPDIPPADLFHAQYLFADIIKSSGRPRDAIKEFTRLKNLPARMADRDKYESLIEGKIAECYFDLQDFNNANQFALRSVNLSPDSSIRDGGHAVNYIIIGYAHYLNRSYREAMGYYGQAQNEYFRYGEPCETPLVYAKIAMAYHSLGEGKLAELFIQRAISVSDSCKIESYVLLSKYAGLAIYRESRNFEKALFLLIEINDLNKKIDTRKNGLLMAELETKYQTRLMENENENLKKLTGIQEKVVRKQKLALILTVSGIIVLAILIFMLIRVSKKRRKAERSLSRLNFELEKKVAERTIHLNSAKEEILNKSKLLSRQNDHLSEFCHIISHDLRSPLINISVLIDFLEKSKDDADRKAISEKLKSATTGLTGTFNELVEALLVRLDEDIKPEKINFSELINKIISGMEGEIKKSMAVFDINLEDAPDIFFPPEYMRSIFQNLLSNALKYRSPERNPAIKIQTKKAGSTIILTVADNGLGIDLEKHGDKIFKIRKIFHEHPDAKGLGLYLTKVQVEKMGGNIRVESIPGLGSTFIVEFENRDSYSHL